MITDTLGDLREAQQTGIHTIAVTWGFHNKVTLLEGRPTSIVDYPYQLSPQIRKILKLKYSQRNSNKT